LFEAQIRTYFKTERPFLTQYTCVIITNTNRLIVLREITVPEDGQSPTIAFKYMSLLILTTNWANKFSPRATCRILYRFSGGI